MDERKDPMSPGANPGAGDRPGAETVRYEHTEVRVRNDQGHQGGARIYDDRGPQERPSYEDRGDVRDRYGADREGRFESDSGRIRAGIDHTRRDIDETIVALQEKLSPERLMNRFLDSLKGTPGHGSKRLMEIIRDNPVPAALVGAGIGWLVMEKAGVFDRYAHRKGVEVGRHREGEWLAPGATYYPPGTQPPSPQPYGGVEHAQRGPGVVSRAASAVSGAFGAVRSTASGLAHGARTTYSTARETLSSAGGTARETMSSARERMGDARVRVREGASHLSERAQHMGHRARESAAHYGHAARENAAYAREKVAETYDDYPLAMAGLAVAGGLILGMLLPPTRREDELMGDVRDDILDRAKGTGHELYESGQRVASAAVEAARSEAEAEDLTPNTVMRSARRVVERATEAAKDEAKHEGDRIKEKVGIQGGPQATGGQGQQQQQRQGSPGAQFPQGQRDPNQQGGQKGPGNQGGQRRT